MSFALLHNRENSTYEIFPFHLIKKKGPFYDVECLNFGTFSGKLILRHDSLEVLESVKRSLTEVLPKLSLLDLKNMKKDINKFAKSDVKDIPKPPNIIALMENESVDPSPPKTRSKRVYGLLKTNTNKDSRERQEDKETQSTVLSNFNNEIHVKENQGNLIEKNKPLTLKSIIQLRQDLINDPSPPKTRSRKIYGLESQIITGSNIQLATCDMQQHDETNTDGLLNPINTLNLESIHKSILPTSKFNSENQKTMDIDNSTSEVNLKSHTKYTCSQLNTSSCNVEVCLTQSSDTNHVDESTLQEVYDEETDLLIFNDNSDIMRQLVTESYFDTKEMSTQTVTPQKDFFRTFTKNDIIQDNSKFLEVNKTTVPVSNLGSKRYFCPYCKELTTKFARHLENIHKGVDEVKRMKIFPKGSRERLSIIDKIRKKGAFEYNTDVEGNYGIEKQLIVSRRPQKVVNRTETDYECCSKCLGYFSKLTLRHHFRKCDKNSEKGKRNIMKSGRTLRRKIHEIASYTMQNDVFPVLRDDDITNVIRFDKLIILYGNKLLQKFRASYHHKMIRAKLRSLGRFMLGIKNIDSNITDLTSVYNPKQYDNVIKNVNFIAGLDESNGMYKSPSYAFNIGTTLKKIALILISECIKEKNKTKKKEVENFLLLLNEDYGTTVNKTVEETQSEQKRNKTVVLPNLSDIKLFKTFLDNKMVKLYNLLKRGFILKCWKLLASYTLVSLLVFNRRRPGEIERIKINDYKNIHGIENIDENIFNSLSEVTKQRALDYQRIEIRGKLGRSVPVLVHRKQKACLELILKLRSEAEVPPSNPYVFGLPSKDGKVKFLSACDLIREYSTQCGAKNPSLLRATQLRKHIATHSIGLELNETEVSDLANFMGHAEKIHREIYRIPIPAREISLISNLLETACQTKESNENEDTENEEQAETSNFSNISTRINTDAVYDLNEDCNRFSNKAESLKRISSVNKNKKVNSEKLDSDEDNVSYDLSKEIVNNSAISVENSQLKGNHGKLDKNYLTPNKDSIDSLDENSDTLKQNKQLIRKRKKIVKLCSFPNNDFIDVSDDEDNDKTWKPDEVCSQNVIEDSDIQPPLKIRRRTWNTPERTKAKHLFKTYLQNKTLPSLKFCNEIANKYFPTRTAQQVKAWVNNKIKQKSNSVSRTKGSKITWETPEKTIVKKVFHKNILEQSLPSLDECERIISQYSLLRSRKATTIKAFVNNEIQRRKLRR